MKKLIKVLGILVLTTAHLIAAPSGKMKIPDFLKGDAIPEGATHDWNLGATGARGWIFSNQMVTSEARQIYITKVDARSPAANVLKVGDVILGVFGKLFSYDPGTEFGKALTIAESDAGKGNLSLICWRQGKQKQLVVKLPVLGTYRAIVEPAPSGIMFADQIQTAGLKLFAKHGISEGIELTAAYAKNMKQHASEKRITVVMELMKSYGAHGQRAIPMLEDAIDYFDNKEKSFPKRLGEFKSKTVRDAIKEIKESTERPKLRSIKSAL
ncbi:DUF6288 domain-containing protein [Rubritalea profundi]|uniref:PDZ domain-containing protein n=1 Tax=Rubritalea profundi TaxID=1658618 RepID=A0A2S7TY63_9BACT|nr:DUF6288 domain-containing protein [Rubritalea profundi]PQJ27698.1 hypothetical protein BSZ32_03740 [Rubritalea profundi]